MSGQEREEHHLQCQRNLSFELLVLFYFFLLLLSPKNRTTLFQGWTPKVNAGISGIGTTKREIGFT